MTDGNDAWFGNLIQRYELGDKMALVPAFKIGICNAWIFMTVFVLQMLAIILAENRVRARSHVPIEARQNKLERYIGIIGNLIWFIALGYSVFLPLQIDTIWFYIGLTVFLIGLALMATATLNFIKTPADQLIRNGAYQYSRHPMYLATFFICLGSGIAALSWLFIFFSLCMAFCFYQEAYIEERYCLNIYGNAYQAYMSRTSRWIGVPKKNNT